jgi:hypothetical protein
VWDEEREFTGSSANGRVILGRSWPFSKIGGGPSALSPKDFVEPIQALTRGEAGTSLSLVMFGSDSRGVTAKRQASWKSGRCFLLERAQEVEI